MNRIALLHRGARQRGVTLVELMIALVLGALVVLAATAMVVSSRATYRTQDESTRLAETARFGLELTNRMVRLAGFTVWGGDAGVPPTYVPDPTWAAAPDAYATSGPNIVGANNSKPTAGRRDQWQRRVGRPLLRFRIGGHGSRIRQRSRLRWAACAPVPSRGGRRLARRECRAIL